MGNTCAFLLGQFVAKVTLVLLLGLEILAVVMSLMIAMVINHAFVEHCITGLLELSIILPSI